MKVQQKQVQNLGTDLASKLTQTYDGNSAHFLAGDGQWRTPPGGGAAAGFPWADEVATVKTGAVSGMQTVTYPASSNYTVGMAVRLLAGQIVNGIRGGIRLVNPAQNTCIFSLWDGQFSIGSKLATVTATPADAVMFNALFSGAYTITRSGIYVLSITQPNAVKGYGYVPNTDVNGTLPPYTSGVVSNPWPYPIDRGMSVISVGRYNSSGVPEQYPNAELQNWAQWIPLWPILG